MISDMSFDKVDPRNKDEEILPEPDYDIDEFDEEEDLTVKPKIVTLRDFEMWQFFKGKKQNG